MDNMLNRYIVNSVAFSPDSKQLASGGTDSMVHLWDVATGNCIDTLAGHTDWVTSVAFSDDGETLASWGIEKTVRLWDLETKTERGTLTGHDSTINCFWSNPYGKPLKRHTVFTGVDKKIAEAPDGNSSMNYSNVRTGAYVRAFEGKTSQVNDIAFSPDGRSIAWAGKENAVTRKGLDWVAGKAYTVCLLHIAEKRIETFTGHTAQVNGIAFSPDGCSLASGSADGTIRLWNIWTGEETKVIFMNEDL